MGLDVAVYKNLKEVKNPQFDEEGYLVNYNSEWIPRASMELSERFFPGRGKGIEFDKVYTYTDAYSFRVGSYSWYNLWRDNLNKFKGDIAFQELIIFSDCEGVIGPIVSKKLYEDFKKYEDEAKEFSKKVGESWLEDYYNWMEAFDFASDGGAVEFC